MFQALGLLVCDDGDAIQQRVLSQRNKYLKDKTVPDPSVRARADQWFRDVEALQNRRPGLSRVVYEHFAGLSRAVLAGAVASGITTLTPHIVNQLRTIAMTACRTDEPLTDRFLADFMRDEGLQLDEDLVRASMVEDFTAISGQGEIRLSWTMPPVSCDEVEIAREPESGRPAGRREHAPEIVYRGRGMSFVDRGLRPGVWYIYAARSIYQGVTSTEAQKAQAVCLGDVREARAAWKDGRLRLEWELPAPGASVAIFRRVGGTPALRRGPAGPEPDGAGTARVYRGSGTAWNDSDVAEGLGYGYRIVAEFGPGLFSGGVDIEAKVPKAPPAVPSATAAYRYDSERNVVVVEWQPAVVDAPTDYVVVRREGSAPASRVEEGAIVRATAQCRCLDDDLVSGRRYTYTVFARTGEVLSRTGAAAPPVDILSEVTGLAAKTASGTVELSWTTPSNVGTVLVRRSLGEPRDHTDGVLVPTSGPGHARDERLKNGLRYHYLVYCAYRPDGVTEVFSHGVRISATPEEFPEPVNDLTVEGEGEHAICRWTPPQHGHVVVLRSASPVARRLGDLLSAAELDTLGERIVASDSNRAADPNPDPGRPYYTPFTVSGSHAVVGAAKTSSVSTLFMLCPDVSDLRLSAARDGVVLRWTWPSGCKTVRVVRRIDAWPAGAEDSRARRFACSRAEYVSAGERFADTIGEERGRLYYIVYAQSPEAPSVLFAPGLAAGCRQIIQWEPWMTMRYALAFPKKGTRAGGDLLLKWSVERPFPDFSGFVLVANQSTAPSAPEEGVELFRWEPTPGHAGGDHHETIGLDPIRRRRWPRFFCKAFVIDSAQRHATLVIHPNTNLAISDAGELLRPRKITGVDAWHPGIPKTVICPLDFEQFPVDRILYSSWDGGEPVRGRYTWLDRMLGRKPRLPTDGQGRRLTRKLCPSCKEDLPFTAGSQASLVIGLIGARFSGKSHYIAALVRQLQTQVGGDLDLALIPATQKTVERYESEFAKPLFERKIVLEMTAAAPPPLIYDLTLSGAQWNEQGSRTVTLALYDTAGENFDSHDIVRQMVKYLGVASGILLLVDPLQWPAVRQALPSSMALPDLDQTADPNVILDRILPEVEHGKVVEGGGPLSIPAAVVVTKCDVIRAAGLVEENRLWCVDRRHVRYFDTEAHDDMSGMMAEYMQRWSPSVYNKVRQKFSRYAFFGVSATGCSSDSTGRYRFVSPWRVEDPLLWILKELGVIPPQAAS